MKVLRMSGALGNQMVKYAMYLALKKRFPNEEICIDDRIYEIDHKSGRIVLGELFGIDYLSYDEVIGVQEREDRDRRFLEWKEKNESVSSMEYIEYIANIMYQKGFKFYRQYGNEKKGMNSPLQMGIDGNIAVKTIKNAVKKNKKLSRLIRPLYHSMRLHSDLHDIYVDETKCNDEEYKNQILVDDEDAYYLCHWEQYDYWFRNSEDEIRKTFVFPDFNDIHNQSAMKKIRTTNAVSVHIRRDGGMGEANEILFANNYYSKSIGYIKDRVEKPVFYIFAFNIDWCKENYKLLGFSESDELVFVDWNKDNTFDCVAAYRDMQLMSMCKHNIIANSTFSFWGGYLNNNPDKIVCCPKDFHTKGFVQI